jgi:glycosyltransferase involved in cell wall biosynthesis
MRFSVIIPSFLSMYQRAAIHRPQKFIRAIDSLLNQTFTDWEAIIVADGCATTRDIYQKYYSHHSNIQLISIEKQRTWSAVVRNTGILAAQGEFITYLDTDDKLGPEHLAIIDAQLNGVHSWVWYDDYIMQHDYIHKPNPCELKYGKCGTSNITHRRDIPVMWSDGTYRHDWVFIQKLMQHGNYSKINSPQYYICHIPEKVDV